MESKKEKQESSSDYPEIAVLIPCFNEEQAIARVIQGFKASLPTAVIYVYDNNSKDRTAEIARQSGAIVRSETRQGKGNVVRRMFSDIEADIYVLVDGDGTYDASHAPQLVEALLTGPCDMVTGVRDLNNCPGYVSSHKFGTRIFGMLVDRIFKGKSSDIFSGYRVFSRRFVKSFPLLSTGFEIETELTIHALELQMNTAELKSRYQDREPGSKSKLNTFRDGLHILNTIMLFIKEERPIFFFSLFCALFMLISVVLAIPVLDYYIKTGLVFKYGTAILSSAFMMLAFLCLTAGFILSSVTTARKELKRLFYLSIPGPPYHSIEDVHNKSNGK